MNDPRKTHEMDQALAALRSSTGMALSVLRGAVESGATAQETSQLLYSFWSALLGRESAASQDD